MATVIKYIAEVFPGIDTDSEGVKQMAGYFDGDKMMKEYAECRVTVTEAFELNWYPGFCRAVFTDAEGKEHIITDKLPVIGIEDEEVEYLPLQKSIRVKVVKDMGETVEIDISEPDGLEDEEEKTRFVVSRGRLFYE